MSGLNISFLDLREIIKAIRNVYMCIYVLKYLNNLRSILQLKRLMYVGRDGKSCYRVKACRQR